MTSRAIAKFIVIGKASLPAGGGRDRIEIVYGEVKLLSSVNRP
jgi:hypothetical protein